MIGMQGERKENIMRLNKHQIPGIYAIPALIISSSPSFPPCAANLPFRSAPPLSPSDNTLTASPSPLMPVL